jgi:divalent metal cation (Fe/Co/Zn/Cd) transporter
VELDRNMTLDKVHEILTKIRKSLLEDFNAEDAVIIPKPG